MDRETSLWRVNFNLAGHLESNAGALANTEFPAKVVLNDLVPSSLARSTPWPEVNLWVTNNFGLVHTAYDDVGIYIAEAPSVVITNLVPWTDGGIGDYYVPAANAYPLDMLREEGDSIDVWISIYNTDGCHFEGFRGTIVYGGGAEIGPHRIIPEGDPWINFVPPHDDYIVTIHARDDGRPLGDPCLQVVQPMGTIAFESDFVEDNENYLIGTYTPPYGYNPDYGDLVILVDNDPKYGWLDSDGSIYISEPIGAPGTHQLTVIVQDIHCEAGIHPLASNSIPIKVSPKFGDPEDDDLVITAIDLYYVGPEQWIKITVIGCVNTEKVYVLMGSPELKAKGDPSYTTVEDDIGPMIKWGTPDIDGGEKTFDFPMPKDGLGVREERFFYYARGYEP